MSNAVGNLCSLPPSRCSLSRFEMYDAQLHTLVQMWEDYDCSPESLSLTISDLSSQGLMLLSGLFTIRHLTLKRGFRIHALALQELLSYLPNLTSLKLVSCSLEDLTLPVMPMVCVVVMACVEPYQLLPFLASLALLGSV